MEITPRELRDVEIREAFRGYHRDEVNELLEKAAATIESAGERIRQLSDRLSHAQGDAGRTRETEDILQRTLLLAQRAADDAVAEAQAQARQMLEDAESQARRSITDAEAEARVRGEAERRRLEQECFDLAGRRDALEGDVEALARFEAEYRDRLLRGLEADLSSLRGRPSAAPGQRPALADVEIPAAAEGIARRHDVDASMAPVGPATQEIDARALLERDEGTPPPLVGSRVEEVRSDAAPIDLRRDEPVEAQVLDDEAFFATLRDAVRDDAPLGPREEALFDQERDEVSFKQVFKRRR